VNIFFFNKYLAYLKFQCFTWTESTCDQVEDIQASQISVHKFIHSTKWPKPQKQNFEKPQKNKFTLNLNLYLKAITFNIQLRISHQNYCYFTHFAENSLLCVSEMLSYSIVTCFFVFVFFFHFGLASYVRSSLGVALCLDERPGFPWGNLNTLFILKLSSLEL
jgi:hypothetical protein